MFPGRVLIGFPIFEGKARLQQRRRMSEHRLPLHRRPVPVELQERKSSWTDLKRPPFLLVKSFLNLRHMDADYGRDIMRVTDELSFQPHRTLFINILRMPHRPFSDTERFADMADADPLALDPGSKP
ncbi:uncharacterized protein LOC6542818 [Drosophila erecta]|uniref:Uncharacterized protein n=1 Tax=Drosophila erecta TaxID=7220 RepID=B3N8S1_DROER|nr:uncharacterized protein LOC6542818 [Drosophila erecta]EDV59548.1 uncharacterized protein Dere_GG23348 [Drosophila erecta]